MKKQKLGNSQYRLRQLIGYLGVLLPIIVYWNHGKLLSSISHYYYTSSSVFFIGILFAFGLILIAYKGYPKNPEDKRPKKREWLNDSQLTTIAGVLILIAVIIPTRCSNSLDIALPQCDQNYLFGHKDEFLMNTIHLPSAGGFLSILGYMSLKKFTRSEDPNSQKKHGIYRRCGYIVLGSVGLLILLFIVESIVHRTSNDIEFSFNRYVPGYVFILETVAVWSFGISWLIKGKVENDLAQLGSLLFRR